MVFSDCTGRILREQKMVSTVYAIFFLYSHLISHIKSTYLVLRVLPIRTLGHRLVFSFMTSTGLMLDCMYICVGVYIHTLLYQKLPSVGMPAPNILLFVLFSHKRNIYFHLHFYATCEATICVSHACSM